MLIIHNPWCFLVGEYAYWNGQYQCFQFVESIMYNSIVMGKGLIIWKDMPKLQCEEIEMQMKAMECESQRIYLGSGNHIKWWQKK